MKDYIILIRESLPQAGVVFLNATIARMDWILLGILSTSVITAEYSFAYRVFELSPLPLLVIAPILLSRFSRFFSRHDEKELLAQQSRVGRLVRFEMIAATFIPLLLNMIWAPVMDAITDNKYGEVNVTTFFILSCCVPFLYMNNLLWSIHFAQNKLGLIFRITLCSFVIIVTGNLLAIPFYGATGAAIVYLFAIVVEYSNYLRTSFLRSVKDTYLSPLLCLVAGIGSGLAGYFLAETAASRLLVAVPLYSFLLLATKQLRKSDIRYVADLASKKTIQDQPSIARSEI
jgi:O-antigen/teichoic acid export membrane protein